MRWRSQRCSALGCSHRRVHQIVGETEARRGRGRAVAGGVADLMVIALSGALLLARREEQRPVGTPKPSGAHLASAGCYVVRFEPDPVTRRRLQEARCDRGAVVVTDPRSGDVLALVARGPDVSPGSTFKPILTLNAIQKSNLKMWLGSPSRADVVVAELNELLARHRASSPQEDAPDSSPRPPPTRPDGRPRGESEVERARNELRRRLDEPDAFFAGRELTLSSREADGEWWADVRPVRAYGRGASEREAKASAVRRWMAEEEAPDLRRRPGEPLP